MLHRDPFKPKVCFYFLIIRGKGRSLRRQNEKEFEKVVAEELLPPYQLRDSGAEPVHILLMASGGQLGK